MHSERRSIFSLARRRVRTLVAPRVVVSEPPSGIEVEWDVAVRMRDGTRLRVNVFRPSEGRFPAILSAHP